MLKVMLKLYYIYINKDTNFFKMKLYIRNGNKAENIKELLQIWRDGSYFLSTYIDENCETPEYNCGQRRSFEDILKVCRTYFPNTTELELMSCLKELKTSFYYCSNIKKIVFHYILGRNNYSNLKFYLEHDVCIKNKWENNSYTAEKLQELNLLCQE